MCWLGKLKEEAGIGRGIEVVLSIVCSPARSPSQSHSLCHSLHFQSLSVRLNPSSPKLFIYSFLCLSQDVPLSSAFTTHRPRSPAVFAQLFLSRSLRLRGSTIWPKARAYNDTSLSAVVSKIQPLCYGFLCCSHSLRCWHCLCKWLKFVNTRLWGLDLSSAES